MWADLGKKATELFGILHVEHTTQDEYHVYQVGLKVLDGFIGQGISRKQYRALGYALRDIANALISSGQ